MRALVVCFFVLFSMLNVYAQSTGLLKKQIETNYLPDFNSRSYSEWLGDVDKFAKSQKSDGTWADIDYTAVKSLDYSPRLHLSRTAVLAEAYSTPNQSYYQSKALLEKIRNGLEHWFNEDYQSYNWWHNEIGVQQYILRALVLTKGDLGDKLFKKSLKILKKTNIDQTGQNRMWRSEIVFVRSILEGKEKEALKASNEIEGLLVFNQEEGIQTDGSFLQHGSLIYNGGYGDKFVQLMAKFLAMVDGTAFDIDSKNKQRFINHVLDAQFWLTRNNKYDYGIMGRSLTVKNRTAINLGAACESMSKMNVKEKERFKTCADSILNNKVSGLEGNKAFYRSDTAVQQEKSYFASVRMYSKRTNNNDAPSNGEGLMSHHLSDGAMMLYKDGSEYENIFPVWDWNKIPGTTVEQKKLIPAQYIPGRWDLFEHIRFMGKTEFAGSVSNGRYGGSGFHFIGNPNYDQLNAKKSWFFFNNVIFALGSDIQCLGCEKVETTLNQTLSKGEVQILDHSSKVSSLTSSFEDQKVKGLLHQNVGYIFPEEQLVSALNKTQKGDWRTINSSLKSEMVSSKVFTASINHGENPINSEYVYMILPEMNLQQFASFRMNSNFDYFKNSNVHAVYSKAQSLLQASFFTSDSINLGGIDLSVSGPCMVMIDKSNNRQTVSVSDPTQRLDSLKVSIDGKTYMFELPQGPKAGASVSMQI